MPAMIQYAEFDAVLATAGAEFAAAEGHGVLCGLLCAKPAEAAQRWLAEILTGTGEPADDSRTVLQNVLETTRHDLQGSMLSFTPLLPDDEETLAARVTALAAWCEGFLFGLGAGGLAHDAQLSSEAREVLQDFAELARNDAATEDGSEEDEVAYTEIVEYLRAGTQLVHDELNPAPATRMPGSPHIH